MEKIWALFEQLHDLLKENPDLKTYREMHLLTNQLAAHIQYGYEWEQRELKDRMAFFQDASMSESFSFGQCGDEVYWKVVEDVLYIGGRGPMWDFDNAPQGIPKNGVFSPWRDTYFHTVVIENGVTAIGDDAFHGADISGVVIPNSVKRIGTMAFFDASIERLILPNTIETIEEDILTGFRRVVDTLVVSVEIPNIRPDAFFNRDDVVANTIYLTGDLPATLTPLIESCLFDDAGCCTIYYPEAWDTADGSFFEQLSRQLPEQDRAKLKDVLVPYRV